MSLSTKIQNIFVSAQKSSTSHPKIVQNLIKIYLESDFEKFLDLFVFHLKHCLIVVEKNPCVERTLNFAAKFASSVKAHSEATEKEDEPEEVDSDVDPFLVSLFKFLLENHEANSKAVRFRICQLINKILNNMGEQACIDDELYNVIYDTMLQRLMDKVPAIRVQAILALARLQDPQNKECPVIKAYRFHLSMDPNPEVRKTALNSIAITFQTLPDILDRIRDVRDTVRRQAYLILAQKVHLRSFTIAQRVLLISEGLNDRSDMVKQAVLKNLLQTWLRLANGSILELLTCLDVEVSTTNAELALANLFAGVPYATLLENFIGILNDRKVIDSSKMKPEAALYWKCLAKHLRKEGAEESLEEILPDLSIFCNFIKDYIFKEVPEEADPQETAVKMMEKDFICQQLLSMCPLFDLSDEVGRQRLNNLVRELFLNSSLGDSCIGNLAEVFALLHPAISRITLVAEIISDLREPPSVEVPQQMEVPAATPRVDLSEEEQRKSKIQLAKITVSINQVRDELEDCIRSLNLEKAQELKLHLEQLEEDHRRIKVEAAKTPQTTPHLNKEPQSQPQEEEEEAKPLDDALTLTRCLTILNSILMDSDINTLNSILRSLHDNLILPSVRSEDPNLRKQAVKSLSLVCLIAKDLALLHLPLIVQISQVDIEEIQLVALKGVFDILQLYGVEDFCASAGDVSADILEEEESDFCSQNQAVGRMISTLSQLLNDESRDIRTLVAEGLCKLLLTSRISSAKLLTHLILLWYNPNTEEDSLLRHMLGVFFPFYAGNGGSNQESLCQAVLPTLQTLLNAPLKSPLAEIDIDDVASFLISITSPAVVSKKSTETVNAHDTLVFSICSEIIAFPNRDHIKTFTKCLNQLSLTPTNFVSLKQVDVLIQKILKKVIERPLISMVEKFHQNVKNFLKFAPLPEDPNEEEPTSAASVSIAGDTTFPSFSSGRKRTLYTTQRDMELISNASESEDDRDDMPKRDRPTPTKLRTSLSESDHESTLVRATLDEVEVSSMATIKMEEDTPLKDDHQTSTDLFSPKSTDSVGKKSPPSSAERRTLKEASSAEEREVNTTNEGSDLNLTGTPNDSDTEEESPSVTPCRTSSRLLKRQSQGKQPIYAKAAKAICSIDSPIALLTKRSSLRNRSSKTSASSSDPGSKRKKPSSGVNDGSTGAVGPESRKKTAASASKSRSASISSQSSSSSLSPPFKKKQKSIKVSNSSCTPTPKPTSKGSKSKVLQSRVMLTPLSSPYLRKFKMMTINDTESSPSSSQPYSSRSSTRSLRTSRSTSMATSSSVEDSSSHTSPLTPTKSPGIKSKVKKQDRVLRSSGSQREVAGGTPSSNDSEGSKTSSTSSLRRSSRSKTSQ